MMDQIHIHCWIWWFVLSTQEIGTPTSVLCTLFDLFVRLEVIRSFQTQVKIEDTYILSQKTSVHGLVVLVSDFMIYYDLLMHYFRQIQNWKSLLIRSFLSSTTNLKHSQELLKGFHSSEKLSGVLVLGELCREQFRLGHSGHQHPAEGPLGGFVVLDVWDINVKFLNALILWMMFHPLRWTKE